MYVKLSVEDLDQGEQVTQPISWRILLRWLVGLIALCTAAYTQIFIVPDQPPLQTQTDSTKATNKRTGTILNATGYVIAQRQAAVSSKATGRLKELKVVEGDEVRQGDVLAVLENSDLEAQMAEADANLSQLKSNLVVAEAQLKDAQREAARARSLRKQRLNAPVELERAETELISAQSNYESQVFGVAAGQARFEQAKIAYEYTFILAPFDGTVLTKNADIGEIVAPFGNSTNARAAVVTIADMSSMQVEADVAESQYSNIFVGQECDVVLESIPDKTYRATVAKIIPTVDRAKATVLTKIRFESIDSRVLPEMSARVAFHSKA